MDDDFIPIGTYWNNLVHEVNSKLGLHPIYNVSRVLNLDEYQEHEGYNCNVHIGHLNFSSNINKHQKPYHYTEKLAEDLATRNAYIEMLKRDWKIPAESRKTQKLVAKEKFVRNNIHKVLGVKATREGWQSIVNMGSDQLDVIYQCGKYMSDEMFAMQFKDIVRYITKNVAPAQYRYSTRLHEDSVFTGYTSVLDFNGRKFESLGLMVDEYQAEQSAAEVCLRTLRFIPDVAKEKFIIQPYQGGISRHGDNVDKPFIFSSSVLSDLLEAFLDSRNMHKPFYYIKNAGSNPTPDFNIYGETEQKVDCASSIAGKIFKAPFPSTLRTALQLSTNEALDYFGLSHPQARTELRKHIRINRYDFSHVAKSLYKHRPSACKGWIWPCFFGPVQYDDSGIESLLNSEIIMNNLPDKDYMNELVKREMQRNPSFKDRELTEMSDLCVAEVDANNPNLFIIGNIHFSFKVLIEDGKIYSKQRNATVEVLPGHNIRKLRCEYRVSLPSLDIHLKAIDCHDLYYSNPPLPVVTSCGVVVLYHDYQASREDVFVLVKKRSSGTSFETNIHVLQGFLHTLITANTQIVVTPAECTEGIEKWPHREVKLLSEMTMDSLCELMSTCTKYDTRWNELLARSELLPPLKELQDICLNELKRREDEGISEEDENEGKWELPQSEFVTRFDTIGIHLEDSLFCGVRAIAESVGIRIKYADIETCPVVDIPVEGDKKHRGDIHRYYICKGANQGQNYENKNTRVALKGYRWVNGRKPEHGKRSRYPYEQKKSHVNDIFQYQRLMSNIEYVNADGSRTKFIDTLKYKVIEKIQESNKDKNKKKDESNVQCTSTNTDEVVEDPVQSTSNGTNDVAKDNVQITSDDDLPTIPLPGDSKYESYKASLSEYCKLNNLAEPSYKPIPAGKKKSLYCGTVKFGAHYYRAPKLASDTRKADLFVAKHALKKLGYLKLNVCEVPETPDLPNELHQIHLPGDDKFTSYKSSLQMLCAREKWHDPKYSFKREQKGCLRGAVICGRSVIVAKEVVSNVNESCARVAYDALCQYGYLKNVKFEAGFTQPSGKLRVFLKTKRTRTKDSVDNVDDHNADLDVDEPSDSVDTDADVAIKEYYGMNEPSNSAVEADQEDPVEMSQEPIKSENWDGEETAIKTEDVTIEETAEEADQEVPIENDNGDEEADPLTEEQTNDVDNNPVEAEEECPVQISEESIKKEDDGAMEETSNNVVLVKQEPSTESTKEVTNRGKSKVINEWIRDDDIQLEELGTRKYEVNRKRLKRKRYREHKLQKRLRLEEDRNTTNTQQGVNEWGKHDDIKGFKKDNANSRQQSLNEWGKHDDIRVFKKGKEQNKSKAVKLGPDMSWVSPKQRGDRSYKGWRKPRKAPPFPARDAYREQCMWIRLDEAIEVCPIIMTLSQTSQFKEQLKQVMEEGNKSLEYQGCTETVKISLLSDV